MYKGQLLNLLATRAASGNPVRVGLIGAGTFGTGFLSQARRVPGLHVLGVADISVERAHAALQRAGWPEEQYAVNSFDEARKRGATLATDDSEALLEADGLDVVIEATGLIGVGVRHALKAIEWGRHLVMVNVETDVLLGPLLARRAAAAGLVYSLAYGDQPAMICELVEWARSNGFDVVCAGKGTKYLPGYHTATPDNVWKLYDFSAELIAQRGFNPHMYTSFRDGSKSAIEMAAVANATGLTPQAEGLHFPPAGVDHLAHVCRPRSEGGQLTRKGTVEVVSSLERDGRPVYRDLAWGIYVVIEAPNDFIKGLFVDNGLTVDSTGRYAANYRPYHLVGMELCTSVVKAGLWNEPTGAPAELTAVVMAVAKRDLGAGEVLDGSGGYCVYGKLAPADDARQASALPIGLAENVKLKNAVPAGQIVRWSDVQLDAADPVVALYHEMEQTLYASGPPH